VLVSESFLTVRERAVCVWMGGGEKKCVDVRERGREGGSAGGELALFVGCLVCCWGGGGGGGLC